MSSEVQTAVRDPREPRRVYRRVKDEKPDDTIMKEKVRLMKALDEGVLISHVIAGFVHLVSFGVLLTFYLTNAWDLKSNSVKGQLSLTKIFAHEAKDVQTYDLFPILIAIPAVAVLAHVIQIVLIATGSDDSMFKKDYLGGLNRIRWTEYIISAGMQTFIIAQLSGSVNLWITFAVAFLGNFILQTTGYFHERANRDNFPVLSQDHEPRTLNWWWFVVGCVVFLGQWSWLIISFYVTKANAEVAPPAFVEAVFWVTFALFALFGLLVLFRGFGWSWFYPVDRYEILFIIFLSPVAKLAIDWIIFGGIVAAF